MNREILCRPFPPEAIKSRPGNHGKTLSYVDVAAVITRLNEGCESWSFEVVSHKVEADEVIVLGKLTADGQTKMHFGGSMVTLDKDGRAVSIADDLKAAASDALKKCASLFGVALELYGGAPQGNGNGRPRERAPEPDDRVTARQLAAIQAVCRRQNIGREDLVAGIQKKTGKTGPQFLTKTEASAILTELGEVNGTRPAFRPE
jgi:hypothetical protein